METLCAVCWLLSVLNQNPYRPGEAEVELCGPRLSVAEAHAAIVNAPQPRTPVFYRGKAFFRANGPVLICTDGESQ